MSRITFEREPLDGDEIAHVHSYRALRQTARDWEKFSNDALGRIQIPAEDKTRTFRQYPIETDPPVHTVYRALVQDMFNKPFDPAYAARIEALVDQMVTEALAQGEIEIVEGFALPLQSRALTHLLGMPMSEADLWTGWGLHVFRAEHGYDLERAGRLVAYIADRLDRSDLWPGSLFAYLRAATFEGRPLTRDEQMGMAHLVFAGGRDTVIRLVSGGIAYLAQNPAIFTRLKAEPGLAVTATEELVRYLSPLQYLGRICRDGAVIDGVTVAPGQRVALCYAQANRDPEVFPDPDRIIPDRRPNPHVGFGSGPHSCPGSAHARLLSRTVMQTLARRVSTLAPATATGKGTVPDGLAFETLQVRLS
jgi:cytochrome P450